MAAKTPRRTKKVGDIIPAAFRNCGASLGLQYPYIYAHDLSDWIIWHGHTGEIVYIVSAGGFVAESECSKKCHEMNGCSMYPDAKTLAEIDATP